MPKINPPEAPECAKISALKGEHKNGKFVPGPADVVQEFLEWLLKEHWICKVNNKEDLFYPIHKSMEQWMAEFFNIDLQRVAKEKHAMVEYLRLLNAEQEQHHGSSQSSKEDRVQGGSNHN